MPITPEQIAALIDSPYRDEIPKWEELPKEPLQRVMLLRKSFPSDAVPAILESELRHRGRAKFHYASGMFFDREVLEQSSGEHLACHRAPSFQGCETVADLTCGLGSDAFEIAHCGKARVFASDLSAARVDMSRWNVRILYDDFTGDTMEDEISFRVAAAEDYPSAEGYFLDPSRRVQGRRSRHLADLSPSIELVLDLARQSDYVGVKLSSATPDDELDQLGGSIDFLSTKGVCREAFVRFKKMSTGTRRAIVGYRRTVETRTGDVPMDDWGEMASVPGTPGPRKSELLGYILEPDPAIIRAGLIPELCHTLNAAIMDPQIAYLTSDSAIDSPLVATFEVLASLPLSVKAIKGALRELEIGQVDVKKRGVAQEVDEIRKQVKSELPGRGVVIMTRLEGKAIAFICRALPQFDQGS